MKLQFPIEKEDVWAVHETEAAEKYQSEEQKLDEESSATHGVLQAEQDEKAMNLSNAEDEDILKEASTPDRIGKLNGAPALQELELLEGKTIGKTHIILVNNQELLENIKPAINKDLERMSESTIQLVPKNATITHDPQSTLHDVISMPQTAAPVESSSGEEVLNCSTKFEFPIETHDTFPLQKVTAIEINPIQQEKIHEEIRQQASQFPIAKHTESPEKVHNLPLVENSEIPIALTNEFLKTLQVEGEQLSEPVIREDTSNVQNAVNMTEASSLHETDKLNLTAATTKASEVSSFDMDATTFQGALLKRASNNDLQGMRKIAPPLFRQTEATVDDKTMLLHDSVLMAHVCPAVDRDSRSEKSEASIKLLFSIEEKNVWTAKEMKPNEVSVQQVSQCHIAESLEDLGTTQILTALPSKEESIATHRVLQIQPDNKSTNISNVEDDGILTKASASDENGKLNQAPAFQELEVPEAKTICEAGPVIVNDQEKLEINKDLEGMPKSRIQVMQQNEAIVQNIQSVLHDVVAITHTAGSIESNSEQEALGTSREFDFPIVTQHILPVQETLEKKKNQSQQEKIPQQAPQFQTAEHMESHKMVPKLFLVEKLGIQIAVTNGISQNLQAEGEQSAEPVIWEAESNAQKPVLMTEASSLDETDKYNMNAANPEALEEDLCFNTDAITVQEALRKLESPGNNDVQEMRNSASLPFEQTEATVDEKTQSLHDTVIVAHVAAAAERDSRNEKPEALWFPIEEEDAWTVQEMTEPEKHQREEKKHEAIPPKESNSQFAESSEDLKTSLTLTALPLKEESAATHGILQTKSEEEAMIISNVGDEIILTEASTSVEFDKLDKAPAFQELEVSEGKAICETGLGVLHNQTLLENMKTTVNKDLDGMPKSMTQLQQIETTVHKTQSVRHSVTSMIHAAAFIETRSGQDALETVSKFQFPTVKQDTFPVKQMTDTEISQIREEKLLEKSLEQGLQFLRAGQMESPAMVHKLPSDDESENWMAFTHEILQTLPVEGAQPQQMSEPLIQEGISYMQDSVITTEASRQYKIDEISQLAATPEVEASEQVSTFEIDSRTDQETLQIMKSACTNGFQGTMNTVPLLIKQTETTTDEKTLSLCDTAAVAHVATAVERESGNEKKEDSIILQFPVKDKDVQMVQEMKESDKHQTEEEKVNEGQCPQTSRTQIAEILEALETSQIIADLPSIEKSEATHRAFKSQTEAKIAITSNVKDAVILTEASNSDDIGKMNQAPTFQELEVSTEKSMCVTDFVIVNDQEVLQTMKPATNKIMEGMADSTAQLIQQKEIEETQSVLWDGIAISHDAAPIKNNRGQEAPETSSKVEFPIRMQEIIPVQERAKININGIQEEKQLERFMHQESQLQTVEHMESTDMVCKLSLDKESEIQRAFTHEISQTLSAEGAQLKLLTESVIQEGTSNMQQPVIVTDASSSHETKKINPTAPTSEAETLEEVSIFKMDTTTDQEALETCKNGLRGMRNTSPPPAQQSENTVDDKILILHDAIVAAHVAVVVESDTANETPDISIKLQFPVEEDVWTVQEVKKAEKYPSEEEKLDNSLPQTSKSQIEESFEETSQILTDLSFGDESAATHGALPTRAEEKVHAQQMDILNAQDGRIFTEVVTSNETAKIFQTAANPAVEVSEQITIPKGDSITSSQEQLQTTPAATNKYLQGESETSVQLVQQTDDTLNETTSVFNVEVAHAAAGIQRETRDEAIGASSKLEFQITAQDTLLIRAEIDQNQQQKVGESLQQALTFQSTTTSQSMGTSKIVSQPSLHDQWAVQIGATYQVRQIQPEDNTKMQHSISTANNEAILPEASTSDKIDKINQAPAVPKLKSPEEKSICKEDNVKTNDREVLQSIKLATNKNLEEIPKSTTQQKQQIEAILNATPAVLHDGIAMASTTAPIEHNSRHEAPRVPSNFKFPVRTEDFFPLHEMTDTDKIKQEKLHDDSLQQVLPYDISDTSESMEASKMESIPSNKVVPEKQILEPNKVKKTQPEYGLQALQSKGGNKDIPNEAFESQELGKVYQAAAIPEVEVSKDVSNFEKHLPTPTNQKELQTMKPQKIYGTAQLLKQTSMNANNNTSVRDGVSPAHGNPVIETESGCMLPGASSMFQFQMESQDNLMVQDQIEQEKLVMDSMQTVSQCQAVQTFENQEALKIENKLSSHDESMSQIRATHKVLQTQPEDEAQSLIFTETIVQECTSDVQDEAILTEFSISHKTDKTKQPDAIPDMQVSENISPCKTYLIDQEGLQSMKRETNRGMHEISNIIAQVAQETEATDKNNTSVLHDVVKTVHAAASHDTDGEHETHGATLKFKFEELEVPDKVSTCGMDKRTDQEALQTMSPTTTEELQRISDNLVQLAQDTESAVTENIPGLHGTDHKTYVAAITRSDGTHEIPGTFSKHVFTILNRDILTGQDITQACTSEIQQEKSEENNLQHASHSQADQQGMSVAQVAVILTEMPNLDETGKKRQAVEITEADMPEDMSACEAEIIMKTDHTAFPTIKSATNRDQQGLPRTAQLLQKTEDTVSKHISSCPVIAMAHAAAAVENDSGQETPNVLVFSCKIQNNLMVQEDAIVEIDTIQQEKQLQETLQQEASQFQTPEHMESLETVSKLSLQEESETLIAFTNEILQTLPAEGDQPQQLTRSIIQGSSISNAQDAVSLTETLSSNKTNETNEITLPDPYPEVQASEEALTSKMAILTNPETIQIIKPSNNSLQGVKNIASQLIQRTEASVDETLTLHDALVVTHVAATVEGHTGHETPGASTKSPIPNGEQDVLTVQWMEEAEKLDQDSLPQVSYSQIAESSEDWKTSEMLRELPLKEALLTKSETTGGVLQTHQTEEAHLQQLTKGTVRQGVSNAQDASFLAGALTYPDSDKMFKAAANAEVATLDKVTLCKGDSITSTDWEVIQTVGPATNEDVRLKSDGSVQLAQQIEVPIQETTPIANNETFLNAAAVNDTNKSDKTPEAFSMFTFQAQDILITEGIKESEVNQIQQEKLIEESLRQALQSQIARTSQRFETSENPNKPCLQEQLATQIAAFFEYEVVQTKPEGKAAITSNVQDEFILTESSTSAESDKIKGVPSFSEHEVSKEKSIYEVDHIIVSDQDVLQPGINTEIQVMSESTTQLVQQTGAVVYDATSFMHDISPISHSAALTERQSGHETQRAFSEFKFPITTPEKIQVHEITETDTDQLQQDKTENEILQQASKDQTAVTSKNNKGLNIESKPSMQDIWETRLSATCMMMQTQPKDKVQSQRLEQQDISKVENAGSLEEALDKNEVDNINQDDAIPDVGVSEEVSYYKMDFTVTSDQKVLEIPKLESYEDLHETYQSAAQLVQQNEANVKDRTSVSDVVAIALGNPAVERDGRNKSPKASSKFEFPIRPDDNLMVQEITEADVDQFKQENLTEKSPQKASKSQIAAPFKSSEALITETKLSLQEQGVSNAQDASFLAGALTYPDSDKMLKDAANAEVEMLDEVTLCKRNSITSTNWEAIQTVGPATNEDVRLESDSLVQLVQQIEVTIQETTPIVNNETFLNAAAVNDSNKADKTPEAFPMFTFQARDNLIREGIKESEVNQIQQEKLIKESLRQALQSQIARTSQSFETSENPSKPCLQEQLATQIAAFFEYEVVQTKPEGKAVITSNVQDEFVLTESSTSAESDKIKGVPSFSEHEVSKEKSIYEVDHIIVSDQNVLQPGINTEIQVMSESTIQLVQQTGAVVYDATSFMHDISPISHSAALTERESGHKTQRTFSEFKFPITTPEKIQVHEITETDIDQLQQDKPENEILEQASKDQTAVTSKNNKGLNIESKPSIQGIWETHLSATHMMMQTQPKDKVQSQRLEQQGISKVENAGSLEEALDKHEVDNINQDDTIPDVGVSEEVSYSEMDFTVTSDQNVLEVPKLESYEDLHETYQSAAQLVQQNEANVKDRTSVSDVVAIALGNPVVEGDGGDQSPRASSKFEFPIRPEDNLMVQEITKADVDQFKQENLIEKSPQKASKSQIAAPFKSSEALITETKLSLQKESIIQIQTSHKELPNDAQDKNQSQKLTEAKIQEGLSIVKDAVILSDTSTSHKTANECQAVTNPEVDEESTCMTDPNVTSDERVLQTTKLASNKSLQDMSENEAQELTKEKIQEGLSIVKDAVILSETSTLHKTANECQAVTNPEVDEESTCMTDPNVTSDERVLQTTKLASNKSLQDMSENEAQEVLQIEVTFNKTTSTLQDAAMAHAASSSESMSRHVTPGVSSNFVFHCRTEDDLAGQDCTESEIRNHEEQEKIHEERLQQASVIHSAAASNISETLDMAGTVSLQEESEAQNTATPDEIKSQLWDKVGYQGLTETTIKRNIPYVQDASILGDSSTSDETHKISEPATYHKNEVFDQMPPRKVDFVTKTQQEAPQTMKSSAGKGLQKMSESAAQLLQKTEATLNKTTSFLSNTVVMAHAALEIKNDSVSTTTGAISNFEISIEAQAFQTIQDLTEKDINHQQEYLDAKNKQQVSIPKNLESSKLISELAMPEESDAQIAPMHKAIESYTEGDQNQQLAEAIKQQTISDTQDSVMLTKASQTENINQVAVNPEIVVSGEVSADKPHLNIRADQKRCEFQVILSNQITEMALQIGETKEPNQTLVEISERETMKPQIVETHQILQTQMQDCQIQQLTEEEVHCYEQATPNKGVSVLNEEVILYEAPVPQGNCSTYKETTVQNNTMVDAVSTFQEGPTVQSQNEKEATDLCQNLKEKAVSADAKQEETTVGASMTALEDAVTVTHNVSFLNTETVKEIMETVPHF
eukprot:Gb_08998 [translate_table: standard]